MWTSVQMHTDEKKIMKFRIRIFFNNLFIGNSKKRTTALHLPFDGVVERFNRIPDTSIDNC